MVLRKYHSGTLADSYKINACSPTARPLPGTYPRETRHVCAQTRHGTVQGRFIHNSPESDTERTDMGNMIQPFGGNKNQSPIHPALQTSPKTVVLSKRLRHGRLQTAWSRSRDVPEKAKL